MDFYLDPFFNGHDEDYPWALEYTEFQTAVRGVWHYLTMDLGRLGRGMDVIKKVPIFPLKSSF